MGPRPAAGDSDGEPVVVVKWWSEDRVGVVVNRWWVVVNRVKFFNRCIVMGFYFEVSDL